MYKKKLIKIIDEKYREKYKCKVQVKNEKKN